MDRYDQTHNDIKPQNFLVKFINGKMDLTRIEIVLTDFGMADSNSKGGTPIFASPECFEKKDKKSDIFSFGRVILFILLTKNQFVKWLFVPIKNGIKDQTNDTMNLITQMTSLTNRISLARARILFNQLRITSTIKFTQDMILKFEKLISNEIREDLKDCISELNDFR